jgi:hypothetical protein
MNSNIDNNLNWKNITLKKLVNRNLYTYTKDGSNCTPTGNFVAVSSPEGVLMCPECKEGGWDCADVKVQSVKTFIEPPENPKSGSGLSFNNSSFIPWSAGLNSGLTLWGFVNNSPNDLAGGGSNNGDEQNTSPNDNPNKPQTGLEDDEIEPINPEVKLIELKKVNCEDSASIKRGLLADSLSEIKNYHHYHTIDTVRDANYNKEIGFAKVYDDSLKRFFYTKIDTGNENSVNSILHFDNPRFKVKAFFHTHTPGGDNCPSLQDIYDAIEGFSINKSFDAYFNFNNDGSKVAIMADDTSSIKNFIARWPYNTSIDILTNTWSNDVYINQDLTLYERHRRLMKLFYEEGYQLSEIGIYSNAVILSNKFMKSGLKLLVSNAETNYYFKEVNVEVEYEISSSLDRKIKRIIIKICN